MQQSTIDRFINPKTQYNCQHSVAVALAQRLSSWWGLVWRVLPLNISRVCIVPADGQPISEEEDQFSEDMFLESGLLYDVPMNYYLQINFRRSDPIMLNAGNMALAFMISPRIGYTILRRTLREARASG